MHIRRLLITSGRNYLGMSNLSERLTSLSCELRLYTLAAMPHHLIEASLWQQLEAVLVDLEFIEAKCAVGMTHELIMDYWMAIERCNLPTEIRQVFDDFGRFMRSNSHLLIRQPSLVFQ